MSEKRQLVIIWFLSLIQGVTFSIIKIFILTSPLLVMLYMNNDTEFSSLPLGMNMVGTGLAIAPFAFIQERIGCSKACFYFALIGLSGLFITIISIPLMSVVLLSIGLLLFGFFNGSIQYYRFIGMNVAGDNIELKNKAVSYVILGGLISTGITPVILNFLLKDESKSFSHFYLIYSLAALLCLISVLLWKSKLLEIKIKSSFSKKQDENFWFATFITSISYFVMVFLMTPTTSYLKTLGWNFISISFVMQIHFLGMFLPSLFVGYLINKFGRTKIAITGFIIMLLGSIILTFSNSVILFAIGLGAIGVGWNFTFIAGSTLLANYSIRVQMKNTLLTFIFASGGGILAGFILSKTSWKFMCMSASLLCLIGISLQQYHRLMNRQKFQSNLTSN